MNIFFILTNILLGFSLAMDAFSVSIANGLAWPNMSRAKMCLIAGTYGFFQFAMPMIGWRCVFTAAYYLTFFQRLIPWLALILLLLIGGKMISDGIKANRRPKAADDAAGSAAACKPQTLSLGILFAQGIATSIDALSVGFTIADYDTYRAVISSLIIAVTTFVICMCGLLFGKKFGGRLADRAGILGGAILIAIGIEVFVRGVFF